MLGRQPDGYHRLDSLAVFAPHAADRLELDHAPDLSLSLAGPFGPALAPDPANLVLRAAGLLARRMGRPVGAAMRLHKNLPVASGIGGGSADAAAALRGLGRLWSIDDPIRAALPELARQLGADVPVCLDPRPCRMRGIGEVLDPVALPEFGLLLANPGHALATRAVFAALDPNRSPSPPLTVAPHAIPPLADAAALAGWLAGTRNDLQAPAIALCPDIADLLTAIGRTRHCLLARMSGSGATCFGLYPTRSEARAAGATLPAQWWHAA